MIFQWIGLRKSLQENPIIFMGRWMNFPTTQSNESSQSSPDVPRMMDDPAMDPIVCATIAKIALNTCLGPERLAKIGPGRAAECFLAPDAVLSFFGAFHGHGAAPFYGWFISWKIPVTRLSRGTPISGNLHLFTLLVLNVGNDS